MGKKSRFLLLLLSVIIFLPIVYASVKITEIELNPEGSDSGNEWLELYSDSEINLNGWKLINNDLDELLLDGIIFSGIHVFEFEKQWLDNSDEKVLLYEDSNIIYETSLFEDAKDNNLTWVLCKDEWAFMESSKGIDNCPSEVPEEEPENLETQNASVEEPDIEDSYVTEEKTEEQSDEIGGASENSSEDIIDGDGKKEVITWEAVKDKVNDGLDKTSDSDVIYKSKNEKLKENSIYLFAFFLLFAIFSILLKKKA